MLFDDLNWMDVESYLKQDDRVMFVVGATEQHAYLSLSTDVKIPYSLAAAAAHQTNVLLAPPLYFGVSPYFMAYPGTISLSQATFEQIVTEVVAGFFSQGFKRVLILNGHGGNGFVLPKGVKALLKDHSDYKVKWYSWWKNEVTIRMMKQAGHEGSHANWLENFPFNRVAESPKDVKTFIDKAALEGTPQEVRAALGDGSYGGVYQMPDDFMQQFFVQLVNEVVQQLNTWD